MTQSERRLTSVDELTPERLAELRRIAEAATPGPWAVNPFRATVECLDRQCAGTGRSLS